LLLSAPELDLAFALTGGLAMDGIELGSNPTYYGHYYSINKSAILDIVPIIPPSD
jgi:hypothetical protein